MEEGSTVQHSPAQGRTRQDGKEEYSTVQYRIRQYRIRQYSTVQDKTEQGKAGQLYSNVKITHLNLLFARREAALCD